MGGNWVIVFYWSEAEKGKGKRERKRGQRREGDRSRRGDLGSGDANLRDVASAWKGAAARPGSAVSIGGGRRGERSRRGRQSSRWSGWKGTGAYAALGAASRGDAAEHRAEQLRSQGRISWQRTSRRREGLREEGPTCGSKMHPTQLEMRSELQFHSGRMRGASD